jgi:ABC-2 type transport system ATP-binding protein
MSNVAIRTEGLTKRFGTTAALDELDLEVPAGMVFGFLGPNGAGKTTAIRLLLDLLRPTSGRAEILGLDTRRDCLAVRRRIGYLPGELSLPERLTGRRYLADLSALRGRDDGPAIDALAERLRAGLDQPLGELSSGNKRKIGLIAAFVHEPEVLILDEPTGGIDPLVQQTFREMTREVADAGRTVFLSSHVLDEVQHTAHRVAVLRAGKLIVIDDVEPLLRHAARAVEITFTGTAPAGTADTIDRVPGISDVALPGGNTVTASLTGPAGDLLAAIAPLGPSDLRFREGDLEDVFITYYEHHEGDSR